MKPQDTSLLAFEISLESNGLHSEQLSKVMTAAMETDGIWEEF